MVLSSDWKDLALRPNISKDEGYWECRRESSLEYCTFWYLATLGGTMHWTAKQIEFIAKCSHCVTEAHVQNQAI